MKTKVSVCVLVFAFLAESVLGDFHTPREVPPTANWYNIKDVPTATGSSKVHISSMLKKAWCWFEGMEPATNSNSQPVSTWVELEDEDGVSPETLVSSTDFPLWKGELISKTNSPIPYKKIKGQRGNTIGAVLCLYSGITRWSLVSISNLTVFAEIETSVGTNIVIQPSRILLQAVNYRKDPDNGYWRRYDDGSGLMPPISRPTYSTLKSMQKSRLKADDLILCLQFSTASINASLLEGVNNRDKLTKAKELVSAERRRISICVRFVDERGNPYETRTEFRLGGNE